MRLTAILAFLVFSFTMVRAQQIPESRLTDWTKAGLIDRQATRNQVNILDFDADPSGKKPSDAALTNAIKALDGKLGRVFIPAGNYLFTKTVAIPSNCILVGSGSNETVLRFNLGGKGNCIEFKGGIVNKAQAFKKTYAVGEKTIEFSSEKITTGQFIFIRDLNFNRVHDSWALKHFGQVVQVQSSRNNTLTLRDPLRHPIGPNSDLRLVNPVMNSGIQGLKIIRLDATSAKTSNILFHYAANCFVEGVESEKCNYAHIESKFSVNLSIAGNYLHHGHDYGSGGKAYGVLFHFSTSSCLVENNVFEHLRHSMLLQAGSNGNVFAYNYSRDPYWSQSFFPSGVAGDIVLHGNWPYLNLFEGNVIQNLVVDGSHGKNGPNNTFFRNRMEYMGITGIGNPSSDNQNFIGNEITSTGWLSGLYLIFGENHWEQYNLVDKEVNGKNTKPDKTSLFIDAAPAYFTVNDTFPPMGILGSYNQHKIPAQVRYEKGIFTYIQPTANAAKEHSKEKDGFWNRLFKKQ